MGIVKAEYWHFGAIKHEHGKREFIGTAMDKTMYAELYSRIPSSFTLIKGGDILAIGGIVPMWPGVGEVWLMRSTLVDDNGLTVAREVKKALAEHGKHFWRLQAACAANDDVCHRWLEWLGFEREAELKMFGPDKSDFVQYRRLTWK